MKFSTLAITGLAAAVSADSVSLGVEATNGTYSGSLSALHEGAGFSYFAVAGSPNVLDYDGSKLTTDVGNGITFSVGFFQGFLAYGAVFDPATITFDDKDVLISDKTFWACNNVEEPYKYSASSKLIVYADALPNDSCIQVKVKKLPAASSSSASSSASATATSSAAPTVSTATNGAQAQAVGMAAGALGVAAMLL